MLRRRKEAVAERTGPARILVVNDDSGAAQLECRLLATAGYEATAAESDGDAVRSFAAVTPDCVVLDLGSGGIGQNLKVLDAIRSHTDPAIAGARVVLVTTTSNRMFSWQAGIDAFLSRPFHANELLASVADVLARPDDERRQHRRRELDAARAQGRTIDVKGYDSKTY